MADQLTERSDVREAVRERYAAAAAQTGKGEACCGSALSQEQQAVFAEGR